MYRIGCTELGVYWYVYDGVTAIGETEIWWRNVVNDGVNIVIPYKRDGVDGFLTSSFPRVFLCSQLISLFVLLLSTLVCCQPIELNVGFFFVS